MKRFFRILPPLLTLAHAVAADPSPAPASPPAGASAKPPPPLPPPTVEEFARAPLMSDVTLSPDGRHYAAIVAWESDSRGIVVMNVDDQKRVGGLRGDADIDVYRLFWHGNDRLLFQISRDKVYAYGLFSAPLAKVEKYIPIVGLEVVQVVGQPRARPDRLLIWTLASYSGAGLLEEIRVTKSINISENRVDLYRDLPGLAMRYNLDRAGELSHGIAWDEKSLALHAWDPVARNWAKPVLFDPFKLSLLETDADRDYVWVCSDDGATSSLRRMRIADGVKEPPVHTDDKFSLDDVDLLFSRAEPGLAGVYVEQHRRKAVWFRPAFAEVQQTIERLLPPDEDHQIIDVDDADRRFLVRSQGPRQPGVYHLYDRASGQLMRAAEVAPHLPRERLRPATSVRFTSRDGLVMQAYLTLPAGASKQRPAPLVVMPHGGPFARDSWTYDYEVQFLASRGYAVLQPQYRASSGYRWPDMEKTAGNFEGMRDDVIDATRSALDSGLFDPRRVAIMGGSFGGYLALACSTEEPELYRAAVSFAGVFDWARIIRKLEPVGNISYGYDRWRRYLGDPAKNEARFEAISVLNRLDRLRAPVLLAHGKIDRTVGYEQTKRLASRLAERNHPHEVIYFKDAPHGLPSEKDRVAYLRAVETFLAKNLAPAPAAAP